MVIVASVRALKYHGGVSKNELDAENLPALERGLPNLLRHVSNIKDVFGLPCVVAINAFPGDTEAELRMIETRCRELEVNVVLSEVWAKGSARRHRACRRGRPSLRAAERFPTCL